MTSSGTYAFNPPFSDVILSAYARIQLRRPALTAEHFSDASREGNYLLSEWASKQPLLWESTIVSQLLTQGAATYTLTARTVMLLDVRVETGSGTSTISRILGPLSTVEYDSVPNKQTQGPPSSFWFDRQITPQITFWPVPDDGGPYTAKIRSVTQVQDATSPNGTTLDIPYRALDAFIAGLAYRLARVHRPEMEQTRKTDYMEAWNSFSGNDVENVPMFISPQIGYLYR